MSFGKIIANYGDDAWRAVKTLFKNKKAADVIKGAADDVAKVADDAAKAAAKPTVPMVKQINTPAIDEFIASAPKQQAKIIGDNMTEWAGVPYRVVTKKLKSGTVVSEAHTEAGLGVKEVFNHKKSAISYFKDGKVQKAQIHTVETNRNGAVIGGSTIVKYRPTLSPVKFPGYKGNFATGLTEKANSKSWLYSEMIKAGMIPTHWINR